MDGTGCVTCNPSSPASPVPQESSAAYVPCVAACVFVASCRYDGARTSDKFLEFLKKKLEEDKGFARVEELDKLVKDFVGADKKVGALCIISQLCACTRQQQGQARKLTFLQSLCGGGVCSQGSSSHKCHNAAVVEA